MLTDALIRGRQTTRGVNSYLSGGTIRKLMGGGGARVKYKKNIHEREAFFFRLSQKKKKKNAGSQVEPTLTCQMSPTWDSPAA